MRKLRVKGIVRFANCVRQELARPIAPDRLSQLRESVGTSLRTIDRLLADAGARIDAMPDPSRSAYQFLEGIDFESIVTEASAASDGSPPGSISFPGLRSHLDAILDDLAGEPDEAELRRIQDSIRESSEQIEREVRAKDIRPEQLKRESRAIRGWLAYFSEPEHFGAYLAAVDLARSIFAPAARHSKSVRPPVLTHFRAMKGIFRIRVSADSSRIQLPTGMICFGRETFTRLADLAFGKGRQRQPILDAMLSRQYQSILSEIDLLSGLIERASGIYHNLEEAFVRVNAAYFGGSLPSPRFTWSQTFTVRKLGHYDRMRDTVMVGSTLDRKTVPQCAVDFIVYHELLHKKLGVRWSNGRMAAHTPEFLREEKRFRQYDRAKAVLQNMGTSKPLPTTRKRKAARR